MCSLLINLTNPIIRRQQCNITDIYSVSLSMQRERVWFGNNNRLQQMNELQSDELVRVEPQNVIVFYRNEFQSASSIKITKDAGLKLPVQFQLKTTNKTAYFVSESSGEIRPQQSYRYINILINQQVPLQQCLHDRFKLLINIKGMPPIEKKFKVIIDYKKELIRSTNKDMQRLQIVSKTSGNQTSNPSITAHHVTDVKKSLLKKSQIPNPTTAKAQSDQINIKEDLEQVVKKITERRARLDYLQKQIQKNKSRHRFMVYVAILAMALALFLGIAVRKSVIAGLRYANVLN